MMSFVNRQLTGWALVGVQALLIGALVVLPGRDDWATPSWLNTVGSVLLLSGFAVMVAASLRLGRALTPTPVPTKHGQLTTSGLYRYVRHPIYSGVLLVVAGMAVPSGSWISATVAATTVVFFNAKARWEEARLAERYDDYAAYAADTPRFVPRPARIS